MTDTRTKKDLIADRIGATAGVATAVVTFVAVLGAPFIGAGLGWSLGLSALNAVVGGVVGLGVWGAFGALTEKRKKKDDGFAGLVVISMPGYYVDKAVHAAFSPIKTLKAVFGKATQEAPEADSNAPQTPKPPPGLIVGA